jgi:hypothetical protein
MKEKSTGWPQPVFARPNKIYISGRLLSKNKRLHSKTKQQKNWSWNEQKYNHEFKQGPENRTDCAVKARRKSALCSVLTLMECSFFNRMDFDRLAMDIEMLIPLLKIVADYEMEGKVLSLSMRGAGDCMLKFSKSQ